MVHQTAQVGGSFGRDDLDLRQRLIQLKHKDRRHRLLGDCVGDEHAVRLIQQKRTDAYAGQQLAAV